MFWLIRKLLRRRRKVPVPGNAIKASTLSAPRPAKPEWKRVLTASLEQNSIAPSDEVILHSFDLYRDDLYGPCLDRRHRMADLYAEICADVAALRSLVPALVERATSRHPFEFTRIIDHEEDE